MNHDIFISYSHMQKSIADGVCHYLEENGFKCWMAPRDIPVGSEYGDLIEEAIKTSKVVILVFSEAASISKWVKGEINVAFTEDKPILPFRIDETEIKGGFRVMLNQMHWIDAFPHYADRLPDLLSSICGFLGRKPQKVSVDVEQLESERKAKEAAERERKAEEDREDRRKKVEEEAERARLEKERIEREEAERKANFIIDGHEYVDLGLPSGTLWATCNVGASQPEDYGDYLSWGEGCKAASNWGDGWSMPTKGQWEELMQNTKCISREAMKNGVYGSLFKAINGNELFLPNAGRPGYKGGRTGYYWLSSLTMVCPNNAWCFNSDEYYMCHYHRDSRFSVRPVHLKR